MDARKKEVFFGIYHSDKNGEPARMGEMRVMKPEKLAEVIREPTIFCGDGWPVYQDVLQTKLGALAVPAPAPCHVLRASFVADLARKKFLAGEKDDPLTCVPLYVRPSEAEINYPHLSEHLDQASH
jgi:tRNA threonylcarbamoyladenosine biosynthesis protein TsaB